MDEGKTLAKTITAFVHPMKRFQTSPSHKIHVYQKLLHQEHIQRSYMLKAISNRSLVWWKVNIAPSPFQVEGEVLKLVPRIRFSISILFRQIFVLLQWTVFISNSWLWCQQCNYRFRTNHCADKKKSYSRSYLSAGRWSTLTVLYIHSFHPFNCFILLAGRVIFFLLICSVI